MYYLRTKEKQNDRNKTEERLRELRGKKVIRVDFDFECVGFCY